MKQGKTLMREPDKARYINAVNHIEQQEVPFVEVEVDFTHVEQVLGRKIETKKSYELPPDDYIEFLQRTGMDMAYLHVPWKLGRKEDTDKDGRTFYVDGTIKERSDLKHIKDPGVEDDVSRRIESMLEALEGTNIGTIYNMYNTPFISVTAMGYEHYYTKLLTDPDLIKELHKRVDEIVLKQVRAVLSYPIDSIMVAHILCMNSGPIFSREIMEEFEFPFLQRHIDLSRGKGKIFCYHCDGDNTSLYADFIRMGIQVFQAIELCGDRQDIYALKQLYGDKATFHGNIDVGGILIRGSLEDVEKDVIEHIKRLSIGGGYVCGSCHDMNEEVPHQNFMKMIETIHSTKGHVSTKIEKEKRVL